VVGDGYGYEYGTNILGTNIQGTNSETDKIQELNIHGTNMVLIWHEYGTNMARIWYEYGTNMVLIWY
jgi:hypothetical protein